MARTPLADRTPLALLDAHHVLREALGNWLEANGPYRVVWSGAEAPALLAALDPPPGTPRPALVVVGLHPPDEGGLAVLEQLKALPEAPPSVALLHHHHEGLLLRAYRAGARAVCCCQFAPHALLEALPTVLQGMVVHTAESQQLLLDNPDGLTPEERRRQRLLREISPRQLEVLEAVVKDPDLTSTALGRLFRISARTVESHIRELFRTFGVSSRPALIVAAIRVGVVRV